MSAIGSGHARTLARHVASEPMARSTFTPARSAFRGLRGASELGATTTIAGEVPAVPKSVAGRLDSAEKRVLDILVSLVLLILCLPLFLVVGLAVLVDSPGPPFYACARVGRRGRELRVLKFRKMRHGATGPALTTAGDHRFTRIGPWLAATKLDELPQLWNVLRGDMSLVGPRPEDPGFVRARRVEYAKVLEAKPGITGFSQLAFARERDILDAQDAMADYVERLLPQKIVMDTLYASRRTVAMDVRILLWTAVAMLLRRDVAVHRETGRMTLRRAPRTSRRARRAGGPERRRAA